MRKLLITAAVLLALLGVLKHCEHSAVHPGPGVLAAEAPAQVNLRHGTQLHKDNTTLATRAHFDITARVLSRKDYSHGEGADLVPMDLALGWGRMSDSTVLAKIDISQSGRFYYWRANELPIPRREIETSSANMHLIPADPGVKRQLEKIRTGQVIHLEGFLVDATRPGGWHWNTSMTRNDTGAGACELIYVESVEITSIDQGRQPRG
ncbi:MAG: hypothetical protein ABI389_15480 [Rhodanobacter sp.]